MIYKTRQFPYIQSWPNLRLLYGYVLVAGVPGAGNQGIGPISAQAEHHRKVQGCPRRPQQRSASSPTPTAVATEAGGGVRVQPQGAPQAEAGRVAHQQADLALHHSSASVLAGDMHPQQKLTKIDQHVLTGTHASYCNKADLSLALP